MPNSVSESLSLLLLYSYNIAASQDIDTSERISNSLSLFIVTTVSFGTSSCNYTEPNNNSLKNIYVFVA